MPRTTDLALRKRSERLHGDNRPTRLSRVSHRFRAPGPIATLVESRSRGHDEDQIAEMLAWLGTAILKVATELCGLALRVIVLGSGVC